MRLVSRRSLWVTLCLGVTVLTTAACRTVPLVNPPSVNAAMTPELTRAAIIRALVQQNYTVDEETPGHVRGRLAKNAWAMVVDIEYAKFVAIRYADSVGLDFEVEGDIEFIHENYNVRAAKLSREIERQVVAVNLENRGLPAVGESPVPAAPPTPAAEPAPAQSP